MSLVHDFPLAWPPTFVVVNNCFVMVNSGLVVVNSRFHRIGKCDLMQKEG